MSRPLKLQRQYVKNIGRKVEVTLADGSIKTGPLVATSNSGFTITETVTVLEGKREEEKQEVQTELPYDKVEKKTMIVISF